jgi:hypothetical protein
MDTPRPDNGPQSGTESNSRTQASWQALYDAKGCASKAFDRLEIIGQCSEGLFAQRRRTTSAPFSNPATPYSSRRHGATLVVTARNGSEHTAAKQLPFSLSQRRRAGLLRTKVARGLHNTVATLARNDPRSSP